MTLSHSRHWAMEDVLIHTIIDLVIIKNLLNLDDIMKKFRLFALPCALLSLSVSAAWASQLIYIPLGDTNQVQVIDASTHRVIDTIEDVGNAHGLAITPDNRYLVAGSFSESTAEDPMIPRPETVSEAEHEKHHDLSAKDDSKEVGKSYVSIIDVTSSKVIRRVAVSGAVHHVAVSPDGQYAVATHPGTGRISVVDLKQYETVASIETGPAPNYAVFSNDGSSVYVSNTGDNSISEIDASQWREVQQFAVGKAPEHIVLAPDGLTLYTNNIGDGTASAISLEDGYVTKTYPVGAAPHGIDLSDDAKSLFVTSKGDNTLVAIDLDTGVRRTVTLAPAPYHLTSIRGTNTLYVSSRAENLIWVVDQTTLDVTKEIAIDGIGHQMAVAKN